MPGATRANHPLALTLLSAPSSFAQGAAKERYNEIQQELSQLSTKFSNNLLDATKALKRVVTANEEVEGLPESALALAAQQAAKEGHEGATAEAGPWLFTLDFPSFFPVMTHSKNRCARGGCRGARPGAAASGGCAGSRCARVCLARADLPRADLPCLLSPLSSRRRALREELYRANITRASSGDLDNTPIIERVLTLRQEKAKVGGAG